MTDSDEDFVLDGGSPKRTPLSPATNSTLGTAKSAAKEGAKAAAKPKGKAKTASEQYQKLSQLEHILKRPDTYIGSVERFESEQWIYNTETEAMELKNVSIVPGLFKIFDEILVNAADNKIRDPTMKRIDVKIDPEANTVSVRNDGRGIPVEMHSKEHMYIPELIFGNLLTSSNYDDNQKKVVGGRNGYGAKLCNIFSTQFTVRTADKNSGKTYSQTWHDNMARVEKPIIKTMKTKSEYTEITFQPDLAKFGMDHLDSDILGVMRRRVYDVCGSVRGIRVTLNGKGIKISNFKQYTELYVRAVEQAKEGGRKVKKEPKELASGASTRAPTPAPAAGPVPSNSEGTPAPPTPSEAASGTPAPTTDAEGSGNLDEPARVFPAPPVEKLPPIVYQQIDDRWEIAFAVSDGSFRQVSFVNSIATTSGGTHVELVTNTLTTKIIEFVKKKHKRAMLRPFQVKNNMFIFINCLIENPAFTSQTKEQLTTRPSQYGGKKLELPENFLKKVYNSGIIDSVMDIAEANADKALKKNDGSRKSRITGYPKLEDANRAGTREGHKCTLILTEGDSALTLAVAGLAVVGRNYYGCYPLRGKMLNVREASTDQIMKNFEIQAIKQIMGLQHKKKYDESNVKSLRYGHLMIMTDQDHDGSHIKGLIINFLETSFPGLLEIPNFLIEFITPIVKVQVLSGPNRRQTRAFYNMPEYESWRANEGTTCSYKQKYYKGLGTSSPQEMREYFAQLDRHLKKFHALQDGDSGYIDLAFSKKKADERKEWLRGFQPGTFLDPNLEVIPISDFINKELILFSMADNIRSIPSVVDGFKPSQRKILYGCYKRNLKGEIKVSQLEGYIAEHTGYHHGDASLIQTIISLAQDFVGANNINVLWPHGGFGSRGSGGKDAAAARYIFTELSPITRKIFNPLDNKLLKYMQDDEQTVEPEWYVPVVPMVLVNGADGIGSGWSTSVPQFNPVDIVDNIRRLMKEEPLLEMTPWYKGWTGSITKLSKDKYKLEGRIQQIDETTLEITELPIRMWTINMKEFLLKGLAGTDKQKAWIKDFEEDHGVGIKFIVKLTPEEMAKSLKMGLLERFKLVTTLTTSNMVLFDPRGRIKKYDNANDILEEYYRVRLDYYQRRKDYMVTDLSNQLEKLSSQAKFVKMIIENELVVSNKKRPIIVKELQQEGFPGFDKENRPVRVSPSETDADEADDESSDEAEETLQEVATGLVVDNSKTTVSLYDYLLGMQIWSLTKERYDKLLKQRDEKEKELKFLLNKSAKDLWNDDLEEFLAGWAKFLKEDEENKKLAIPDAPTKAKKKRTRKRKATTPKPTKEPKKAKVTEIKTEAPAAAAAAAAAAPSTPVAVKNEPEEDAFGGAFDAAFSAFKELTPKKDDVKAAPKAAAPKAKKAKKAKKAIESDEDDADEDISMDSADGDEDIVPVKRDTRHRAPKASYKDETFNGNDEDDDDDVVQIDDESDDDYEFEG